MFTLDWFVSLFIFSYRMSVRIIFFSCFLSFFFFYFNFSIFYQTVSRIWDLFLYEGRVSLFCVAVGILREVEKMILKINRMDHLFDLLKNLNKVDLNWEKIIKAIFHSSFFFFQIFFFHLRLCNSLFSLFLFFFLFQNRTVISLQCQIL